MLDSQLLTEVIAAQKQRTIEERIARGRLADIAGRGDVARAGLRATAAAAIVRFGILLDGAAGRRAAALQG
jgi:hypothetical protein